MLGIDNFGALLAAGIFLHITPGGDTMYILTHSRSQWQKAGTCAVSGTSTGIIFHTLAAIFGLSRAVAGLAAVTSIVKYTGTTFSTCLQGSTMSVQPKYNVRVKQWLARISGSVFILPAVKPALTIR